MQPCRQDIAEQAFRKALDSAPNMPTVWSALGMVLERTGRTAEALWRPSTAPLRSSRSPLVQAEALVNRATLRERTGDHARSPAGGCRRPGDRGQPRP